MDGTSGIVADLSCAAGRRCDACSVVVDLGGPRHQLGQTAGLLRMKPAESSVADELNSRAVAALDEAREMPPGGRAHEGDAEGKDPSKCR